jgi:DNA primase
VTVARIDPDELLRRVDLARLLDALAPPAARTVRRRWRCPDPDHEDRHPSVSMRIVGGIGRWRCWSCGRGGTAIDALVAARGLTVGQAIEQLSAQALLAPIENEPADPEPVPLHPSVSRYVDACHRVLFTRTGRPVLDWLSRDRVLAVGILRANRVGADPGPDLLGRRRGLPRSGVGAVLPAYDSDGNLTYVQTRYLAAGHGPKYGNPVTRLGHNPRLAWTRTPAPRRSDLLVVCEGIIDALTAATSGLDAVALLGATYPSSGVADAIAAHTGDRQVVVAFDGDDPGRIAAQRLHDLLVARKVDVRVWDLPEGTDLNGLAQADASWAEHLSVPLGVAP